MAKLPTIQPKRNSFISQTGLVFKSARESITGDTAEIILTGIAPGNYAVSVLHDENDNGKIDANLIGMPKADHPHHHQIPLKMKKHYIIYFLLAFCTSCGEESNTKSSATQAKSDSLASPRQIIGTGKIEPQNGIITLSNNTGGIVQAVLKEDGDTVAAGDALVRLDRQLELVEVQQITTRIAAQKNQIGVEAAGLKVSELQWAGKNKLLQSTESLVGKGSATRQELDDIQLESNVLRAQIEQRQASVRFAQNKLQELYDELKRAETELDKKTLRSPAAGTVLRISAKVGAAIGQYESYAEFAPAGNIIVRAEVDELFSGLLKTRQQVAIRNIGSAEVLSIGKIIQLGAYLKRKSLFSERAEDQEDRRVREIKVSLSDPTAFIINSKVECVIKP